MNFKFTELKKRVSAIIGLIIGFHFGFGYKCINSCGNGLLDILGRRYFFYDWKMWASFILISIITFFVVYLIWSLIQKEKNVKKVVDTKKPVSKENKEEPKKDVGGLFIPAGLFLGMGWGYVSFNFVGGLFLGLGAGFLAFALVNLLKKN